ncbi:MAG: hypothetical protein WCT36_02270 [Candidatus Gracilibacteria bacterium]
MQPLRLHPADEEWLRVYAEEHPMTDMDREKLIQGLLEREERREKALIESLDPHIQAKRGTVRAVIAALLLMAVSMCSEKCSDNVSNWFSGSALQQILTKPESPKTQPTPLRIRPDRSHPEVKWI